MIRDGQKMKIYDLLQVWEFNHRDYEMIKLAELRGEVTLSEVYPSTISRVTLSESSRIAEVNINKELFSEWLGYRDI